MGARGECDKSKRPGEAILEGVRWRSKGEEKSNTPQGERNMVIIRSGCSGRLWQVWRNLVPSDGELHATRLPGNGLHCTRTCFTFWWHIRTIRTKRVLHTSQWLQLCWCHLHNAWMLLVCLVIIATTYRSTFFKSYAFRLYSHLGIYISR